MNAPSSTDPLDVALAYAAMGLRVFPVQPGAKRPQGAAWTDWPNLATTDPAQVTAWWSGPQAGWNVVLAPSRLPDGRWLWVLDVDMHGADGIGYWKELSHGRELPDTVEAVTGGGGLHLLWGAPFEVRNGDKLGHDMDTECIQFRGHGGFIVVEPSTHPAPPVGTGLPYAWVDGQAPWDRPIADTPAWMLEAIIAARTPLTAPTRAPAEPASDRPGDLWAAATAWDALLTRDGWTLSHTTRAGEQHWTRPGKHTREGTSATVNYQGTDTLKMFTSSAPPLQPEATYTKIGYLATTRFNGDHRAAATWLSSQGWHSPRRTDLTISAPRLAPGLAGPITFAGAPPEDSADRPGGGWGPLVDLPSQRPAPPWPTGILPDWMQDQVDNIARQVHCAPDLPAMFMLGALSVVGLGRVEVRPQPAQTEPVAVWIAVVADSAEGKSAALGMAFSPVTVLEEKWIEWAAEEVSKAEAEKAILERKAKKAADSAAGKDGDEYKLADAINAQQLADSKTIPPAGRVTTSDVTPQKLAMLMQANGETMSVVSDEAGILNVDRYGDNKNGSNLDLYLQAWKPHRPVTVDRVTAPSIRLKRPLMAVVVGAQPKAWARVMHDEEWRDRGMGARFMSCSPDGRAAGRDVNLRRNQWDPAVADTYHRTFTELATRLKQVTATQVVEFTPEAQDTWSRWAQPYQSRMTGTGDLAGNAAWVNKMRDTVIRVAGLLHLADGHRAAEPVTDDVMARACRLGDYWVGHRLHDRNDEDANLRDLLACLVKLARASTEDGGGVTERAIARFAPTRLRPVATRAGLMVQLHQAGLIRINTALPDSMRSDPVGLVRSMTGLNVHPDLILETRDNCDSSDRDDGESSRDDSSDENVAVVAVSLYSGFFDSFSPKNDVFEGDPQNPATTATDQASSLVMPETSTTVEPWSLLSQNAKPPA